MAGTQSGPSHPSRLPVLPSGLQNRVVRRKSVGGFDPSFASRSVVVAAGTPAPSRPYRDVLLYSEIGRSAQVEHARSPTGERRVRPTLSPAPWPLRGRFLPMRDRCKSRCRRTRIASVVRSVCCAGCKTEPRGRDARSASRGVDMRNNAQPRYSSDAQNRFATRSLGQRRPRTLRHETCDREK